MRMPKPKLSARTFDAVRHALLAAVDEGEWDAVKGLADVLAALTITDALVRDSDPMHWSGGFAMGSPAHTYLPAHWGCWVGTPQESDEVR